MTCNLYEIQHICQDGESARTRRRFKYVNLYFIYICIVCIYKARASTRAVITKPITLTTLDAPLLTAFSFDPLWFSVGVLVDSDGDCEEEPSDGELELPGAFEPDGESEGF